MAWPQWPIHSGVQILSKLKFFTTRGPDIVLLMASAQSRLHRAVWQKQRGNFMSTFSLVFALYFCNAPSFVVFTMILWNSKLSICPSPKFLHWPDIHSEIVSAVSVFCSLLVINHLSDQLMTVICHHNHNNHHHHHRHSPQSYKMSRI